jgi:hypothetical protein
MRTSRKQNPGSKNWPRHRAMPIRSCTPSWRQQGAQRPLVADAPSLSGGRGSERQDHRRAPAARAFVGFQSAKAANIIGWTDPDVLAIASRENRILVSHDRETMPAHFSRFIEETTSAGLLILSQKLDIREAIEQILIVWTATEAEEWVNRVG